MIKSADRIYPADPDRIAYGGKPLAFVKFSGDKAAVFFAEYATAYRKDRLYLKTYYHGSKKGFLEDIKKVDIFFENCLLIR